MLGVAFLATPLFDNTLRSPSPQPCCSFDPTPAAPPLDALALTLPLEPLDRRDPVAVMNDEGQSFCKNGFKTKAQQQQMRTEHSIADHMTPQLVNQ